MSAPSFIELDGKRYPWREVLSIRRAQLAAAATARQPVLFPLRDDSRPVTERSAAGRYREPSLFAA